METKRTDANQVIPLQLRNTFWNFLEHCSVQSAMLSCHCGYCRRRPLITVFERGNNRSKDTNNYPAEEGPLPSSAAGNLPKQKPWRRTRKIKINRKRFVFCLHSTTDEVHILWLRPASDDSPVRGGGSRRSFRSFITAANSSITKGNHGRLGHKYTAARSCPLFSAKRTRQFISLFTHLSNFDLFNFDSFKIYQIIFLKNFQIISKFKFLKISKLIL